MQSHRARLHSAKDLIEYSLLEKTVPPMRVAELASTFQVVHTREGRNGTHGLIDVARRWTRMLLTGLPGTGKSTALQQLAALWSGDNEAPIPVFVPLLRVAERVERAADLTLPLLIEIATAGTPINAVEPLRHALEKAAQTGEAILLLDGLDEARAKSGIVAEGLARVCGSLPENTGVVVTTRESALPVAQRLGFPHVELAEPTRLTGTLAHLLRHVAEHRSDIPDKERWYQQRVAWLKQASGANSAIWSVPLLATLMTLLAARSAGGDLPNDRARLLAEAVQDSVTRWEAVRPQLPDATWSPQLTAGKLMDGYRELGHLINASGDADTVAATHALTGMLSARWHQSPGDAEELAAEVLRFWDEQTGVFVCRYDARIEPRSRIFAEVGDAMWAARRSGSAVADWVSGALGEEEQRETILLAAGLSQEVFTTLVDTAISEDCPRFAQMSRSLVWTTEALADKYLNDDARLVAVIDRLAAIARLPVPPAVERTRRGYSSAFRRDNSRWRCVLSLASLQIRSAELRSLRDAEIDAVPMESDQRTIARALAVLADARCDGSASLSTETLVAVNSMLELIEPDRDLTDSDADAPDQRRVGPWAGHVDAAEQSIPFLSQCVRDGVERVERLAHRGAAFQYHRIVADLEARGYDVPKRPPILDSASIAAHTDRLIRPIDRLYEAAAMAGQPTRPTGTSRWRLPLLCRLVDAVGFARSPSDDSPRLAQTDLGLLSKFVRAVAHATGINLADLAGEAVHARDRDEVEKLSYRYMLITMPETNVDFDASWLTTEDLEVLVTSLDEPSSTVADCAIKLLAATKDATIGAKIESLLHTLLFQRRNDAAALVCLLSPDPLGKAEELLERNDRMCRIGAAHAVQVAVGHDERRQSLIDRLFTDDDMSVRVAAGALQEQAERAPNWTCFDCAQLNQTVNDECIACDDGTRPGSPKIVKVTLSR
jgi:hypothetical protein